MILTQTEFLNTAFKAYDNPKIISLSEMDNDIKRFSFLKLIITRYIEDHDLTKLRLAINHIVILVNCFGSHTVEMIRYKMTDEVKPYTETILFFLGMIDKTDILDFDVLKILETL